MRSPRFRGDLPLTADPAQAPWRNIPPVVAAQDRYGKALPAARTEIRSLWTERHLYFLFASHYEHMHLQKPAKPKEESWGLWDYDVVEVFIGWDPSRIHAYKEFEVSPQGEWVDLDIDRSRKPPAVDWTWNSGFEFQTRVEPNKKIWFCEMRIPWKSIDPRPPAAGNVLRLNLYRIEGPPPRRKFIAWSPVFNESFHTPERFGTLQLIDEQDQRKRGLAAGGPQRP